MAVVATGFFDGVHPGHRLVIDTLLSEAHARGEQSVVVTFWPHPRAVLQSDADSLRYLTARSGRDAIIRALGVDRVETVPFTREFACMSAAGYLEMLRSRFGCSALVLGYDTRFGREQAGAEEIASVARGMGMDAVITPPVCMEGSPISSTRVREALERGDVEGAAALLGRPYRLDGVVVTGNRLGRTIGFPTANMKLYEPLMCVPGNGVYRTLVRLLAQPECTRVVAGTSSVTSGTSSVVAGPSSVIAGPTGNLTAGVYKGLTNIGVRPTVGGGGALTIETFILDFDEMIYGLDISVEFISRIRDERRFDSMEDLKRQLQEDVART